MRRFIRLLLCVLLFAAVAVQAQAIEASEVTGVCTVASGGSCQVTLTALIQVDTPVEELTFPVPAQAMSLTLNGSRVRGKRTDTALLVDITKITGGMAGNFSVTLTYTLPDVIVYPEEGIPQMQLPILAGFAYPVSKLSFSVNLPGVITTEPAFSSGYHQTGIEEDLHFEVNNASVTGYSVRSLKDHETLTMLLPVDPQMFPRNTAQITATAFDDWGMAISVVLALVYWLLTMRCLPPRRVTSPVAPEGYTAGQLRSVLTLGGMDLSAMVLSWAELGYVFIQMDRHGRVLLHRHMQMGNERSTAERKRFAKLFGQKEMVDCSSMHYAMQCKKAAAQAGAAQALADLRTGNPRIFRGLCALTGVFAGMSFALTIGTGAILKWFLVILLAGAGGVCCYLMQQWAECLFLRERRKLWLALTMAGVFLLFGAAAKQLPMALTVLLIQALGGLMAFYGGRRTEEGRQLMSQTLGLRRYLRKVSREELARICSEDPDYFFTMAPYALALGVDQAFANRFGQMKLDRCPYLTTGMDGHRTAQEWNELMVRTLERMDWRYQQLLTENLRRLLRR